MKMCWLDVKKELPSAQNGYINQLVLVCVKNKNKSDGVYLPDVSVFDGSVWANREYTWEDITHWRPYPELPK